MELTAGNLITDGPLGPSFKIECDTLFIWVNLAPNAFFAHPTMYIFIRGSLEEPIIIEEGEWWPLLNGQGIFQVNKNLGGLVSPFTLNRVLSPTLSDTYK